MKTVEDFKKAGKIGKWTVHNCSMCNYPCGFIIYPEGNVGYDNGCDCVWGGTRESSWEDLADQYNRNAGADDVKERIKKYPGFADVVKKDNEFWGFKALK